MEKKNDSAKVIEFIKKYAMVIVLALVLVFFSITTGGKILLPNNISNIISQNAYVFVLATGMLLCILTGGNIDLSVGSVVCFVGAVGATLMEAAGIPWPVAVLLMFGVGTIIGATQAFFDSSQYQPGAYPASWQVTTVLPPGAGVLPPPEGAEVGAGVGAGVGVGVGVGVGGVGGTYPFSGIIREATL